MSFKIYEKYSGESRMFFGEGRGIQEFVDTPYPEFLKLKDQQRDQQWAHDEFPLGLDAAQLSGANQSIRHIFTSNLQSQIFADSIQGRGPGWLLPYCSDPSLEGLLLEWALTECLTPDHDVLTTEGWKSIDTITTDDKVAQYNPDTQAITFVNPSRTVSKPFKGNLIHFEGYNIDQLVTPNHRMPIMKPYSKTQKKAEAVLAKDVILDSTTAIPHSGYINGVKKSLTSLEKAYILIQVLGTEVYRSEENSCIIYDIEDRYSDGFSDVLNITFDSKEIQTIRSKTDNGSERFSIKLPLKYCLSDYTKYDWVNLSSISSEWCEEFLTLYTHLNRGYEVNDNIKDLLSLLHSLSGHCIGYDPEYTLGSHISNTEIPYDGMVYCLTVPDSAFMVRRNGKISLTFNCLHSRSYTQMLTAMYPNPKIVTDLIEEKPEVFNRFSQATKAYDAFFNNPNEENLVLLIGAINILEGLAFYSSFACNFGFANMGMFESVAKYLALISRDECVTGDHEVLTNTGWVRIDQLRPDQLVAQYNPDNDNITFVVPSKIIKTSTEKLITFKGENVSQVVTPNHRMPVLTESGDCVFKAPLDINKEGFIPVTGIKVGGKSILEDQYKILIPIKLLGYKNNADPNYTHTVLFNTAETATVYEDVLKLASVSYVKSTVDFSGQGTSAISYLFHINVPSSYTLTDLSLNQFLPDLNTISSDWSKEFIEYFFYWVSYNSSSFVTGDKQLVDTLQALAHLCSYHTSVIVTDNVYSLTLIKHASISYSDLNVTEADVNTRDVYCLTVDTGAFLVRYNNDVSVTGNCLHVAFTQKIIKNWSSGKDGKVWQEAWYDNRDKIKDMYISGLHEETHWNKYLFKYGTPIIGLNEKLLNDYDEYMSYKRMKNLGLKLDTKIVKDPLPWIQLKYGTQKNVSNAPQEVKVIAYTKNPVNKMENLKDLKKLII